MSILSRIGRDLLFRFDPETAHGLSIRALSCGLPPAGRPVVDPRLAVSVLGLDFPNPLGMAAGYDKNGEVPDALLSLGFGFAEVGTITPMPQAGNPKPRIFRLPQDGAVINRLGFNNEGHDACAHRLARRGGRRGLVGVNIGANKDSADRIEDYAQGVTRFAEHCSYLAVNISSPNTPGLRAMQARSELGALLGRVTAARAALRTEALRTRPILLKIAPDLGESDLDDIATEVAVHRIDGVIVSNTTLARSGLSDNRTAAETGGLSGRPLFGRSTTVLAKMRSRLGAAAVLIGVGGVDSAATALEKIRAGADLVQLYTGLIYGGPDLPRTILRGLSDAVTQAGATRISDLRDTHLERWAARTL